MVEKHNKCIKSFAIRSLGQTTARFTHRCLPLMQALEPMNSKTKQTIFSFFAGVLIAVISFFTNEGPIKIEISTEQTPWVQTLIMYLTTIISIPLLIAFLNILPERTISLKHIFNAKYFYTVSILILGIGVSSAPYLLINDYNLANTLFIFCFGFSMFIGSLIANKLFGGLS